MLHFVRPVRNLPAKQKDDFGIRCITLDILCLNNVWMLYVLQYSLLAFSAAKQLQWGIHSFIFSFIYIMLFLQKKLTWNIKDI